MKDKDYEPMLKEMSTITQRFIAVVPDNPRALEAENLTNIMSKYCKNVEFSDTIEKAIEKMLLFASEDDIIVALGSLYYIGSVRRLIRNNPQK